uniref:F5/8 type C domain-containing protein n=1 Tax=Noctiluca scintillans TaxID=2966 RepID=A0A7S1FEU6_NOCSC
MATEKVLMVSSLDESHPAEHILSNNDAAFWISTGLYPQEILLERPLSKVSSVKFTTTNVRNVRVEGCAEETPVNFKLLVEGEFDSKGGRLQLKELKCSDHAKFIKVVILSGWHDFCTVHKISIE